MVYAAWNWVVICAGYLFIHRNGVRWKDLGFTDFRYRDLELAVAGTLVGLLIVYPVATWLAHVIGLPAMKGMSYSVTSTFDVAGTFLASVLFGPLAEEIIFRGYLLNLLRVKMKSLWVVGIIGVIMFTLVHLPYFGWGGMLFVFLWSPLVVVLLLWRRSIYPSCVMHVLNNFFAYMVVPLFLR
jgi:hypothetical protein